MFGKNLKIKLIAFQGTQFEMQSKEVIVPQQTNYELKILVPENLSILKKNNIDEPVKSMICTFRWNGHKKEDVLQYNLISIHNREL